MRNGKWVMPLVLVLSPPAFGQYLFWSRADGVIMRSDLNGNDAVQLLDTTSVNGIVVDPIEQQLYIAQGQSVRRAQFDGSNFTLMGGSGSAHDVEGVDLDPFRRELYYSSFSTFRRHYLDTGVVSNLLAPPGGYPRYLGLYLPTNKLLWLFDISMSSSNRLERGDLDATNIEVLATDSFGRFAIDPIHRWVFIIAPNSIIQRLSLHTLERIDLITAPSVRCLAVDPFAQKLYWTEWSAGRIMRSDVDGQNAEVVISGQTFPEIVAVFNPVDCDGNLIPDWCDISCGLPGGPCNVPGCGGGVDCDRNGVLDACEAFSDCNSNTLNDRCEVATQDCNISGVLDECDIDSGDSQDCNDNVVPDECEVLAMDCNSTGVPDDCDVLGGASEDCDGDLVPDECQPFIDCNQNTVRDRCDIYAGTSLDEDGNDVPDECCPPPCIPDPPMADSFGTGTLGAYRECDVDAQDCPAGSGTCERCGQLRYLSFEVPANDDGAQTAIRFRLESLHHPSPPPSLGTAPSFALIEGGYRYLNTIPGTLSKCCNTNNDPLSCNTSVNCTSDADCVGLGVNTKCLKHLCPDSAAFSSYFRCARVGCNPEYRDWSDFSGLMTYAVGETITPSSTYEVAVLSSSCTGNEVSCAAASSETAINTERWGNVDCSNGNNGIPGAVDIARVVNKVQDHGPAFIKPRCQLRESQPNPLALVNAQDLARIVDAAKGLQYPFHINCSAACASAEDCPGGTCVGSGSSARCSAPRPCATNSDCLINAPPPQANTCSANGYCTTAKDACSGLCQP